VCVDLPIIYTLSLYAYLWTVFGGSGVYKHRLKKLQPSIQMDRKRDRMKTVILDKQIMNPLLKKRIVEFDKCSTRPVRSNVTNKLL
jgi:hypothetical protein